MLNALAQASNALKEATRAHGMHRSVQGEMHTHSCMHEGMHTCQCLRMKITISGRKGVAGQRMGLLPDLKGRRTPLKPSSCIRYTTVAKSPTCVKFPAYRPSTCFRMAHN